MGTSNPGRMDEREMARNAMTAAATAQSTAEAAQSAANTAMETADGKNTVSHIVASDPRPVDNADGDLLFEHDTTLGGPVTFMGRWDGSDWEIIELNTEVIAALDAGKITTGTLNAGMVTIEAAIGGGSRVVLDNTGFKGYNAANELKTSVGSDGTLAAVSAELLERVYVAQSLGSRANYLSLYSGTNPGITFQPSTPSGFGSVYLRAVSGSGGLNITSDSPTSVGVSVRTPWTFDTTAAQQSARNSLGLGNTTGPVPIANGGTGATTAAGIRAAIGAAVQEADFSGTITLTSAAGGLSGVFTLPSGMTQSNTLIHPSKQSSALAKFIPYVNWLSSTTFQIGIYSGDGTIGGGSVPVAAYARRIS